MGEIARWTCRRQTSAVIPADRDFGNQPRLTQITLQFARDALTGVSCDVNRLQHYNGTSRKCPGLAQQESIVESLHRILAKTTSSDHVRQQSAKRAAKVVPKQEGYPDYHPRNNLSACLLPIEDYEALTETMDLLAIQRDADAASGKGGQAKYHRLNLDDEGFGLCRVTGWLRNLPPESRRRVRAAPWRILKRGGEHQTASG